MSVIGSPRSFHEKFKFVCEIDDVGQVQAAVQPLDVVGGAAA